jgi:hypothetical protein
MQADDLKSLLEPLTAQFLSELRQARQRDIIRELEKEFVYGEKLLARLRAERALYPIESSIYKEKNFQDLYRGEMEIEIYADVASVLNLFRLLNSYKEAGDIDVTEARRAFGWIYTWWQTKVITHYSKGLENNPDWAPHLKKHEWLMEGLQSLATLGF